MAGPQKVSLTHEALMDWMIANPEKKMAAMAATFGYTQPWLSSIVNSGCFKARLAEKRQEIAAFTSLGVPEKLSNIANMALDRLSDALEHSADPELALKAAELAMKGMGVGAKHGGITLNVQAENVQQVFATQDDLAKARMLMQQPAVQVLPPVAAQPAELPALEAHAVQQTS